MASVTFHVNEIPIYYEFNLTTGKSDFIRPGGKKMSSIYMYV